MFGRTSGFSIILFFGSQALWVFVPALNLLSPFVHFAPVADAQGKDHKLAVEDIAQQPVIADPIAPLPAAVRCQSFAVRARVFTADQVFRDP